MAEVQLCFPFMDELKTQLRFSLYKGSEFFTLHTVRAEYTAVIHCGACKMDIDPTEQVWGSWSVISTFQCPHCSAHHEIVR